MSGVKTTVISNYELDRLRQQARQATTLSAANSALNRMNSSLTASLADSNNRIERMSSMIDRAQKDQNALREQLQQTIRNTNERLREQESQHQSELISMKEDFDQTMSEMRTEMNNNNRCIETMVYSMQTAMQNQMDQLRDNVDSRLTAVQTDLNGVRSIVETIAQNDEELLEMANVYYEEADELMTEIGNYRHELLLPGRGKDTLGHLQRAIKDINTTRQNRGFAPTACNNARIAFESALQLYNDVVSAQQQWQLNYEAAMQAVLAVQATLEESREIPLKEINYTVDTEYWSGGDMSELTALVTGLSDRLANGAPQENICDLEGIRAAAEQLGSDIDDTVAIAVGLAYCSQNRTKTPGQIADEVFARHGLQMESHGYEGGDFRAAYRYHAKDPINGLELVVTTTPVITENGGVSMQIETDVIQPDGVANQEELQRLIDSVTHTLQEIVGDPTAVNTTPGYHHKPSDRFNNYNPQDFYTQQVTTAARPEVAARRRRNQQQN